MEVHKGADGFVSRDEVARAVRELLASEATKANVHKLGEKVEEAMDGSVQKSVKAFLDGLKKQEIIDKRVLTLESTLIVQDTHKMMSYDTTHRYPNR